DCAASAATSSAHECGAGRRSWNAVACSPPLPAGVATADDQAVAGQVGPAGTTLRLALRVDRVTATRGLTLTPAVRVVDRVHGDAADRGPLALPPQPARLAPADVRLVGV